MLYIFVYPWLLLIRVKSTLRNNRFFELKSCMQGVSFLLTHNGLLFYFVWGCSFSALSNLTENSKIKVIKVKLICTVSEVEERN